ncbi:uncharacterized protein LOC134461703 isoform X2 [Engraulis encrasicolus]|uniref:uncharacterized protein LOC134461703 isoform X2 n=1 Tax=Engraulis encrasicolus TaxID=184585 RepID=UPI002FD6C7FB
MEFLQSNKDKLCTLLASHLDKVLDQVGEDISYKESKSCIKQGGKEGMKILLEVMLGKEQGKCQQLVKFLGDTFPEIKDLINSQGAGSVPMYADQNSTIVAAETANTNLKSYKMKADIHGQDGCSATSSQVCPPANFPSSGSRLVATNNSHIFAPKLTGSTVDGDVDFSFTYSSKSKSSQSAGGNAGNSTSCTTVPDKLLFFKTNNVNLIQRIKNVGSILDYLFQEGFHPEMVAKARAEKVPQEQMRVILVATTTKAAAKILFQALQTNEKDLMDELIN